MKHKAKPKVLTEEQKEILYHYDLSRSCKNKRVYHDKKIARAEARKLSRKFGKMRAYSCRHCDYYHIGHNKVLTEEQLISIGGPRRT